MGVILKTYPQVFEDKIGVVKGFEHEIVLKKNVTPVVHEVYEVPLCIREDLRKQLDQLCEDGIIEPVNAAEWVSAVVTAKKKRKYPFMFGFTRVNIVVDCHP